MLTKVTAKKVRTVARLCECCGGGDLESLWYYEFETRTRSGLVKFETNNVICRRCGFVFVSPVYREDDLAGYYNQAFARYAGQGLDYDLGLRDRLLRRHDPDADALVEIGANQPGEFQTILRKRYREVRIVEINGDVDKDHQEAGAIPDRSATTVVHYFVLEHIPHARKFLTECHRILADGGLMICEVPDIAIYPTNPAALQLYEHTNHFSRQTFRHIAAMVGFKTIEITRASRPFGFAAVCIKTGDPVQTVLPSEYAQNKQLFLNGLEKLRADRLVFAQASNLMETCRREGRSFLMWAANDMTAAFLRDHPQQGTVVLDSDASKKGVLQGCSVLPPTEAPELILASDTIFIFTRNHAAEIIHDLEDAYGKYFSPERVHIVDFLPN